jgi:hypothetical protein
MAVIIMRSLCVLLICCHFASASLLLRRDAPKFGIANSKPIAGIEANAPESYSNVASYQMALPTPLSVALNGVYCKGAACQYRVAAPQPTLPPPMTLPLLPIGGNSFAGQEFCKGLACVSGMGSAGDQRLAAFNANCVHLYNDVGGGMLGQDVNRNVVQVHDSFMNVCKKRVGALEVGACPMYAKTFVGAISAKISSPTVGGPLEVCTDTYNFLHDFKRAEIDLKLTVQAMPKGSSLLAGNLSRLGSGGVGPSSRRGLKWQEYISFRSKDLANPVKPQQLATDGSFAGTLLQTTSSGAVPTAALSGADNEQDTARGRPKYKQNPAVEGDAQHAVPQSGTRYEILAGSADGLVPPLEVPGDLFTYCSKQFTEIMMGFAQTAPTTVQLTKDWCSWQASVSSWVGRQQEYGHPDWTHRTCTGMAHLVAFGLQDDLADKTSGLSAQQVCKKVFLSINAVHRTDSIVKEAWETSSRGAPSSSLPTSDNAEMNTMLEEAQEYANKIFSQLRGQKDAYETLNKAKMDTAAVDA